MLTEAENIFLFVPNLIGYGRIILALISFYFMASNYVIAGWCYVISALLDAFDGHAARHFNQSTKFGAMLDQLTDRCGTMGLLVTLSYFYPKYMFWFQISMAIDISCHWIYLHASILIGKTSHKSVDVNENAILRLYYTKPVLFTMCVGNEVFYTALYILYFSSGPFIFGISLFKLIAVLSAPIAIAKALTSLLQGALACKMLEIVDLKERKEQRQKELGKKAE